MPADGHDWRPTATVDTLVQRARFLAAIRAFFARREVLEVDVPALSPEAAVEPHLASVRCQTVDGEAYLHTSPEFGLKRLLAAGSGPIYQLSHVFRDGEFGRWHNPEFTMLEWYRPGWDQWQLIDELVALLDALAIPGPVARQPFAQVFGEHTGLDPHQASTDALADCARALGCGVTQAPDDPTDARAFWLDALMGLYIEPQLGPETPCLVYDFPDILGGLTRLHSTDPPTAARFELYWQGVELANGGDELTDAVALRQRFAQDLAARQRQGLLQPPASQRLLAALEHGLPQCSGVAVGVDRLLALSLGDDHVGSVLPYTVSRG